MSLKPCRYMLEMLSRPYPRRQVLVTADPMLAEPASYTVLTVVPADMYEHTAAN